MHVAHSRIKDAQITWVENPKADFFTPQEEYFASWLISRLANIPHYHERVRLYGKIECPEPRNQFYRGQTRRRHYVPPTSVTRYPDFVLLPYEPEELSGVPQDPLMIIELTNARRPECPEEDRKAATREIARQLDVMCAVLYRNDHIKFIDKFEKKADRKNNSWNWPLLTETLLWWLDHEGSV
jgi:hypothetical protein